MLKFLANGIVYHNYGPPDVLKCEEVDEPVVRDSQVLIRVRAAALNPLDWHLMRGKPPYYVWAPGCGSPRTPDWARTWQARLRQLALRQRSSNQATKCSARAKGPLPSTRALLRRCWLNGRRPFTWEQAASVPVAGYSALQGLRNKGKIQPARRVIVNGAAGGVGKFAVQLAKWFVVHDPGI